MNSVHDTGSACPDPPRTHDIFVRYSMSHVPARTTEQVFRARSRSGHVLGFRGLGVAGEGPVRCRYPSGPANPICRKPACSLHLPYSPFLSHYALTPGTILAWGLSGTQPLTGTHPVLALYASFYLTVWPGRVTRVPLLPRREIVNRVDHPGRC